ncbi:MAG: SDR family oxidoreductase [Caldilineaceae bacterium]
MSDQTIAKQVILGTAQLGLSIMDQLVAQGKPVTLVNRRGKVNEPLPAGVNVVQGDVLDVDAVARLCADAEVVFFCAQPPYTEWPERWPPLMQAVLAGVAQTKAKLVFGDNLYMYGPTQGQPLHEDLPYAATGRKGKTRAQVAQMVLDAHKAGRVQAVLGRAADFYGPRVYNALFSDAWFKAALAGKTVNLLGNLDLPRTYSYIKDYARGLVTLSEHDEAFGRAWHVPNAAPVTTRQFVKMIEAEIGKPIKVRVAGRWLLAAIGLFNAQLREMNEMMYEFEEPYIVDHSQFAAAFGDQSTSHKQAIRETVAWVRQRM